MNQEQNNFNIQNNNEINNQNFNQQPINPQVQSISNYQQPANQINPQPTDNNYNSHLEEQPEVLQPVDSNNILKNKKNLIVIISLIAVVCVGFLLYFVLFNKEENGNNAALNKDETKINVSRFSNSKKTDNIAFTFMKSEGYYALRLDGKNYGKQLKQVNETVDHYLGDHRNQIMLSNNTIKIFKYSNNDEFYYLHDFENDELVIILLVKHSDILMEGSKERYSYTENSKILENHENIYLVEHQNVYKNSSYDTKVIYNIYVLMDDYDFQITFSDQNKEKITEIYEKIKENYSTGYFAIDKDNVITKMTKNKNSDESVDISNWTFATDLIQDFYKKNYGFNIKDSRLIKGYNNSIALDKIGELLYAAQKKKEGQSLYTTVRAQISTSDKNLREELSDTENKIEKINVKGYKEAYIKYDTYETDVYLVSEKETVITIRFALSLLRNQKSDIFEFVEQSL